MNVRTIGLTVATLAFVLIGCAPAAPVRFDAERDALRLVDDGAARLREGKLDEARAAFEVARDLYPTAAAVDGLGCVSFLEGKLGRAEALFLEAYDMDATYDNPLANLALVYEAQGRAELAEEYYRRALAAEPANAKARNNYAAFLESRGARSEVVLRELLRAAAADDHPVIVENLKRMD